MNSEPTKHLLVLPVFDCVEERLKTRAQAATVVDPSYIVTFSAVVDALRESGERHTDLGSWWSGRRFATEAELALLRRQAIAQAREGAPAELIDVLKARGLPRLLARFVDECAEGSVETGELTAFASSQSGSDGERIVLLGRLYRGYRQLLTKHRLMDETDRLRIALEVVSSRTYPLPSLFAGVSRVEIKDIFDWSAARLAILIGLAERLHAALGPPERLHLVVPYSHSGQRLFHYMERALRELEARSDIHIEVSFEAVESTVQGPAQVAVRLFDDDVGESDSCCTLSGAPTSAQEWRKVAREIHSALESGFSLDEVCVALRHPELDREALTDALSAYDIPWRYRRGVALHETDLFKHISGLFTAVVEDLPKESLIRIMTSAFSSAPVKFEGREETGPSSSRSRHPQVTGVAATIGAAGVRDLVTGAEGKRSGYHVRLSNYLNRIRPDYVESSDGPVQGDLFTTPKQTRLSRWYASQEGQVRTILQRVRSLSRLRGKRSVRQWALDLKSLLAEPGFEPLGVLGGGRTQIIGAQEIGGHAHAAISALGEAQRSWVALQRILENLETCVFSDQIALGPGGFRLLLSEVAEQVPLNPPGGRGAAVQILPVRQLVGRQFRLLFLPRLNEGVFPASVKVDPLFKDRQRVAFNRWRRERARGKPSFTGFPIEEPQPEDDRIPVRRSEETLLLALALRSCSERVFVSWCARDTIGRPLLPSLFVEALRRAGAVELESEPLELLPAPERIVSASELSLVGCRASKSISPESPEWKTVLGQLNGVHWYSAVRSKTDVEISRNRFYETPNGAEVLRASDREKGEYCGYLASPEIRTWLSERRFGFGETSPASATRFERYGACPSKFFFQDVLRIQPERLSDEEMDALGRGSLLHEVMDRLYMHLDSSEALGSLLQRSPSAWNSMLDAAFSDAIRHVEREKHLGHPKLRDMATRTLRQLVIDALVTFGAGGELPDGHPLAREWAFGYGEIPALAVPLPNGKTVHFRGRVDRIDRKERADLIITDYKLGRLQSYKGKLDLEKRHRVAFQLSIYALAALRLLDPPVNSIVSQYYAFKDRKVATLDWPALKRLFGSLLPSRFGPAESPLVGEVTLAQGIQDVLEGIHAGHFPAATRDCQYCDFGPLCRAPERIRKKGWPQ